MKNANRAKRALLYACLAVVFAGSVAASAVYHRSIGKMIADRVPAPQILFGTSNLRLIVVGLDYDYNQLDEETSAHSRSDIIMAVDLNFARHRISELSVPRDMVATLPGGEQAKINQAQADGGIRESATVVAQWLGIPRFDRYVVLRIDTMKDLIDAIGGVSVDVKTSDCLRYKTGCTGGRIDYDDNWGHLHAHFVEGRQHLDGPQAVAYARFRHDWCSDPCRIMRQQQVARAIITKLSRDRLDTLLHVPALLAVFRKDVETDLTTQEEESLALSMGNLRTWKIKTAQVPYVGNVYLPNYGDAIVPDENAKRRLVASLLMPHADR
jgi:LCP family protein required for cell wall assembly